MEPKFSVIIPTYTNTEGLKQCLESVIEYTDFSEVEVIVVSNGASKETDDYLKALFDEERIPKKRFTVLSYDEPIGFPRAINSGVDEASPSSQYYVFLNDDCTLLPQEKNDWIRILHEPFLDPEVKVTGPLQSTCPHSNRDFILFFCAMTSCQAWRKFGPLNEEFSPGGGEDILYCIKVDDEQGKIVQVPYQGPLGFSREEKFFVSAFPIYHPGGATVSKIDGFHDHFQKVSHRIAIDHKRELDFGGHSYDTFRKESIDLLWEAYPNANLRVLDIGAGAGAFACLKDKYVVVDAVEVWEPNVRKNNLESKYNHVYNMDIMDFDFEENSYDLVILGDVLEHLTVEDAQMLIAKMKKYGVKNGIIHVPFLYEQGAKYGNEYETHHQEDLTEEVIKDRYPFFYPMKIFKWKGVYFLNKPESKRVVEKKDGDKLTVTATISTRDRFFDTLPITVSSLIAQTVKPDQFLLFEDGEKLDLEEIFVYKSLLKTLDHYGIKWKVIHGEGKGQVLNHQKALEMAETDLIWRLDDDVQPEPNVLETLLEHFEDPEVGAVGSLILFPGKVDKFKKPPNEGKLKDVLADAPNIQWFEYNEGVGPFEVEHLNCSFLYRVNAGAHGYCLDLSPAGHREETLFTYEMFKNGWKLLVDPRAKTWHYRNPKGGIRVHEDRSMWKKDDQIFRNRIAGIETHSSYENKKKKRKFVYLENGKGDHVEFLMILPELLEKYDKVTIACCYEDVFAEYKNDPRVEINHVLDVKPYIGNVERYHIYHFMSSRSWQGHIRDAYREMYL